VVTFLQIKNLTRKSFVRDVGILQASKFISILLSIVGSIVFARYLGPELYGKYGLVFAFVGLAGIFTNWGTTHASVTLLAQSYAKKDKNEIKNILSYFIKTNLFSMPISMVIIILAPFLTSLLYNDYEIGTWSRIILLSGFLIIIYNLLTIVLQSIRKIKQLAIIEFLYKFLYILLPISFVLFGWGISGIVLGHFLTALIFLFIGFFTYSYLARNDQFLPSIKDILEKIKKIRIYRYFKFGFLIALQKNLGNLSSLLPVMFLGMFALPQDIGYFKVALSYAMIPSMVLEPISRLLSVQLPRSKVYSWSMLKKHLFRVTIVSIFITFCLIIVLIVLAPYLIKLLYGVEYVSSIKLVYFMAILPIFSGLGTGFGPFYRAVNKIKIATLVDVISIILRIVLFLTLVKFYSPIISVILGVIITDGLSSISHTFIIKHIFKKNEEEKN